MSLGLGEFIAAAMSVASEPHENPRFVAAPIGRGVKKLIVHCKAPNPQDLHMCDTETGQARAPLRLWPTTWLGSQLENFRSMCNVLPMTELCKHARGTSTEAPGSGGGSNAAEAAWSATGRQGS